MYLIEGCYKLQPDRALAYQRAIQWLYPRFWECVGAVACHKRLLQRRSRLHTLDKSPDHPAGSMF